MIYARAVPLWRPLDGLLYSSSLNLGIGDLVKAPLGNSLVPAVIVSIEKYCDTKKLKDIKEVISQQAFPPSLLELCHILTAEHLAFMGETLGLALPKDIHRPPKKYPTPSPIPSKSFLKLRPDEKEILELFEKSTKPVILTSSADYTALIVELCLRTIRNSRQALILLPSEPALTRFSARFSSFLPVTLYHSNLSMTERRQTWFGVRKQIVPLVAALRSGVLLPFNNLGLIVVFDEDASSHRVRSHHLHYNAADSAIYRAELEKSQIISFSMAPRMLTSHKSRAGKYLSIERKSPQKGKAILVDLKNQPDSILLSRPLFKQMSECRQRGMKSVILLNRLGTASKLICLDCGQTISCPKCGVPMKFIAHGKALLCPICKKQQSAPEKCPQCSGANWKQLSLGLKALSTELSKSFPSSKLCQINAEQRPSIEQVETADIIFGTSALLEYFPQRVAVCAFLSWDTELSQPDFRSSERAFRNLAYLRRILVSSSESRLIVQTFRPKNSLLEWALKGDYERFFQSEIRRRRELGYPPYNRLILFERKLEKSWTPEKLISLLERDGLQILGPYTGRRNRTSLLVKLRRDLSPQDIMNASTLLKSGWRIEIDPEEIL